MAWIRRDRVSGRRASASAWPVATCMALCLFAATPAAAEPGEGADPADLRSVCFVDSQTGWAAGDLGIVIKTNNGGRTWSRQKTPTTSNLRAIQCIDQQVGWAAGWEIVSGVGRSAGVLLRTGDGGRTWDRVTTPAMPGVLGMAFRDARRGWVWGVASALVPSGVMQTQDGGRSWQALPGQASAAWTAGSLTAAGELYLASAQAWARVVGGRIVTGPTVPWQGLRPQVYVAQSADRFVVGAMHGQIYVGGGSQWLPLRFRGAHDAIEVFAAEQQGSQIWLAGAPGDRLLRSGDGGRSWSAQAGAAKLPIYDLEFPTEDQGCAVGALGTIQLTYDGGVTWQRVRGDHDRVALVAIVPRVQDVPWEFLADAACDGYLSRLYVMARSADRPAATDEALSAAALAGGATGAQYGGFWLPSSATELPARGFTSHMPEAALDPVTALTRAIARYLNHWSPAVVLTVADEGNQGTSSLMYRSVLAAVNQRALASPSSQPPPGPAQPDVWIPQSENVRASNYLVSQSRVDPRRGTTVDGLVHRAKVHLSTVPDVEHAAAFTGFHRASPASATSLKLRPFARASMQHGASGRRGVVASHSTAHSRLQRRATSLRNMQALLKQDLSDREAAGAGVNRSQILQATRLLDQDDVAPFLYRLGWNAYRQGDAPLADQAMRSILDYQEDDRYAEAALQWLVWSQASAEMQLRRSRDGNRTAESVAPDARRQEPRQLALVRFPALEAMPAMRLPLLARGRRRQDLLDEDSAALSAIVLPGSNPWRRCVAAELWLESGRGRAPLSSSLCRSTQEPPLLDGRLEEAFWEVADQIPFLVNGDERPAAKGALRFARDDQFLYLGGSVQRDPGTGYGPATIGRLRDPDLSRQDRIELFLDTDRDYVTFWKLVLDHRGGTGESLLGDRTWNPKWYVAASGDASTWSVEVAIAWEELTSQPPQDAYWAISARRIIPGRGVHTLGTPCNVQPQIQGIHLLKFGPALPVKTESTQP